jgi:hypothetical protein
VPGIDGRKGEEAKRGYLEGGLPAPGRDGGVEGLEDGAGPESGGLLLRDRGLAGDPRNSGLGAEDAGDGIRLLSIGGGRGVWVSSPPADTALGCRGGRRAESPGRRGSGRGLGVQKDLVWKFVRSHSILNVSTTQHAQNQ